MAEISIVIFIIVSCYLFNSCRPRLSLAEVLIFSLIFSQALFMSPSSLMFPNAANLFVISIWYCFLTSSLFSFVRLTQNALIIISQLPFFRGPTAVGGPGLLIVEVPQSHSDTPHSAGLLWTSDWPVAETIHNTPKKETSMSPAGFEPAIPASKRPQPHEATGIRFLVNCVLFTNKSRLKYVHFRYTTEGDCDNLHYIMNFWQIGFNCNILFFLAQLYLNWR